MWNWWKFKTLCQKIAASNRLKTKQLEQGIVSNTCACDEWFKTVWKQVSHSFNKSALKGNFSGQVWATISSQHLCSASIRPLGLQSQKRYLHNTLVHVRTRWAELLVVLYQVVYQRRNGGGIPNCEDPPMDII